MDSENNNIVKPSQPAAGPPVQPPATPVTPPAPAAEPASAPVAPPVQPMPQPQTAEAVVAPSKESVAETAPVAPEPSVAPLVTPEPQPVVEHPPAVDAITVTPTVEPTASVESAMPPTVTEPIQLSDTVPLVTASPVGTPPKMDGGSRKKLIIFVMLGALITAVTAVAIFFALASSSANNEVSALKEELQSETAKKHELPSDATKGSECVPNMGFHYTFAGGSDEFGPFYLVNQAGEVIGLEFMYSNDMFTPIPEAGIPLELILTDTGPNISLNEWQFDHIEFSRLPEGHPAFEREHTDVHLYTVGPEEQARACE